MIKKVVKCEICKKKFTGIDAGKHTKETGHNKWELLKPKEIADDKAREIE